MPFLVRASSWLGKPKRLLEVQREGAGVLCSSAIPEYLINWSNSSAVKCVERWTALTKQDEFDQIDLVELDSHGKIGYAESTS